MLELVFDGMCEFLNVEGVNGIREREKSLCKGMKVRKCCDLNLEDVVRIRRWGWRGYF